MKESVDGQIGIESPFDISTLDTGVERNLLSCLISEIMLRYSLFYLRLMMIMNPKIAICVKINKK